MTLTHLENATFIYQTAKSTYFSLFSFASSMQVILREKYWHLLHSVIVHIHDLNRIPKITHMRTSTGARVMVESW